MRETADEQLEDAVKSMVRFIARMEKAGFSSLVVLHSYDPIAQASGHTYGWAGELYALKAATEETLAEL